MTRRIVHIAAVSCGVAMTLAMSPNALALTPVADAVPAVVLPTVAPDPLARSYPVEGTLPVEPPFTGQDAAAARHLTTYSEVAPRLNAIKNASEQASSRVSLQIVGQSTSGRDLYLVTVTAPETAEETARQAGIQEAIRSSADLVAANPGVTEGYKLPVWFNSNVHGTEMEGTDASLNVIERLANATDPSTLELLAKTRLYFTVMNNPDGRTVGTRNTMEAGDTTPGDDGLDANRDLMTNATPEAAMQRDIAALVQPIVYSDYHGYTGTLLLEPATPPHLQSLDYSLFIPRAFDASLAAEKAVLGAQIPGNPLKTAEDGSARIDIAYRDFGQGWDDWPPFYGPQNAALAGALQATTVELPVNSIPDGVKTDEQIRDATRINISVAEVVQKSLMDYTVDNYDSLLREQVELFRRANAGEPIEPIDAAGNSAGLLSDSPTSWRRYWTAAGTSPVTLPRAFMIPAGAGQRSETDAHTLVEFLQSHRVEVKKTTADALIDGVNYPAGSFVVDMHQPFRSLADTLLADGGDITDRVASIYDAPTAWSYGRLGGATVTAFGSTTDASLPVPVTDVGDLASAGSVAGKPGDYLTLNVSGLAEIRAVNDLLASGVAVSYLPDSTAILGPDERTRESVQAVADRYGVSFGTSDGQILRTAAQQPLTSPRVAYLSNDRSPSGQEYQIALSKAGFRDVTRVRAGDLESGAASLQAFDVVVFATLPHGPVGDAEVTSFVSRGGSVIATGGEAANALERYGILDAASQHGTFGSSGIIRTSKPSGGGTMLSQVESGFGLFTPAYWFTGLGDDVVIQQAYVPSKPLLAGMWKSDGSAEQLNQDAAAGQASVISGELSGGGGAVMFGHQVAFRAQSFNGFQQLATAVLHLSPVGVSIPVPAAVISTPAAPPSPSPSLSPSALTPGPDSQNTARVPVAGASGNLAATGGGLRLSLALAAGAAALAVGGGVAIVVSRRRTRAAAQSRSHVDLSAPAPGPR